MTNDEGDFSRCRIEELDRLAMTRNSWTILG